MLTPPLVAAVMITGKDPARVPMALAAIESFHQQTYPNKILIVIDTSGISSGLYMKGYGQLYGVLDGEDPVYVTAPDTSLGKLRNLGLERAGSANADYVIQWDDDDYHHPERITFQMSGIAKGYCTLLSNQLRYDMIDNNAFNFAWTYDSCPGIPGTILHPVKNGLQYPETAKGEDEVFYKDHFEDRCIVLNNRLTPHMYVRMCHDTNTWAQAHIMHKMEGYGSVHNIWNLTREQAKYLSQVLSKYYRLTSPGLNAHICEPAVA